MKKIFSDCVDFVGSSCEKFDGIKRYISTGAIKESFIDNNEIEMVSFDKKPSRANLTVSYEDVLFAKMYGTRKTLLIDNELSEYIYSTGFCAVRAKKNVLTKRCLFYLLNSNTFLNQKDRNCSGATQKAITNIGMQKILVNIPDYKRQNEIVEQFDKLTNIIKMRKNELIMLDELIKARFVEMFGDTVINPLGWEEHRLVEYIIFLTSGSRGWSKHFVDEENELFLTIKNVKNNHISTDNVQYIIAPDSKEAERTKVKSGDLLISITADLGRTGVVDNYIAEKGAYINQHLSLVRLDNKKINPLYVSYFLETEGGKLQFDSKNQNGVKAGLNFDAIKSLKILVPPIEVQDAYLNWVKQINKSKFASYLHKFYDWKHLANQV